MNEIKMNPLCCDNLRPVWLKYAADLINGMYDNELDEMFEEGATNEEEIGSKEEPPVA